MRRLHPFLLTVAVVSQSSLASDGGIDPSSRLTVHIPRLFQIPVHVATQVIKSYLRPSEWYELTITLLCPLSPFIWEPVQLGELAGQINQHLFCESGGTFTIMDGDEIVQLDHPIHPDFYPNPNPYSGQVKVTPMENTGSIRVHCSTNVAFPWHLRFEGDWVLCNDGQWYCGSLGFYDSAWLLDDRYAVAYENRKVQWLEAVADLDLSESYDVEVTKEVTLDHDLKTEHVGFRNQDEAIVEVARQEDTLLITNTHADSGVSSQITARLPESFRLDQFHSHISGKWLLASGEESEDWKMLVIDTKDGSVKQKVPLMGQPFSVEISPLAEYALVSFQERVPIHLIHLDSPFSRLCIIPGTFGYDSPTWLTHELFKIAISWNGTRFSCVRSAAHCSQNICWAESSMALHFGTEGEIQNGARLLCDENVRCFPCVMQSSEYNQNSLVLWKGDPRCQFVY